MPWPVVMRWCLKMSGYAALTRPTGLPANFQDELPSPEQIADWLAGWALESDGLEGV